MGKPKRFNSYDSEVDEGRKTVENYGMQRQSISGIDSSLSASMTGKQFNNKEPNLLSKQNGGKIEGPIGFTAETGAIDGSNQLYLSQNSAGNNRQVRGLMFVSSTTSTTLDEVIGKKYDGQMIILTGISGQSAITITHGSGVAGQILCPGDVNYLLENDESVILFHDVINAIQPTWRLLAGSIATSSGGVTESDSPVTWTGIHSFNGTSTSINSASIFLGDVDTDNLFITAKIASTLIPDADNTYSLGTSLLEWRDLHVDGTGYIDTVQSLVCSVGTTFSSTGSTTLGDSSTDPIFFVGNIDTDVVIDGGKQVKAYDSQEIGLQVTNNSITVGTEGTVQIPWLGASSATKAAADTDFGNARACIGINEIGGTPTFLVRKSDGSWWGVALSSFFP